MRYQHIEGPFPFFQEPEGGIRIEGVPWPSAVPAHGARGNGIRPKETDCCCQQRPARDDTPRRGPRRFVAGGSLFLFTPSGVDRDSLGAG